MDKIKDRSLYLVLTEECANGRSIFDIAKNAISGGVDILQLREKNRPLDEIKQMARVLCGICKAEGVKFIVNDDPVLAEEVEADGVHVGQEDMFKFPVSRIRKIIGVDKIIGVSTHSLDQFRLANSSEVDYISFGPVFPTKTKDYFIGTKDLESVLKEAAKPVFFIGGINLSNLDVLLKKGARNIALIRDIMQADDVAARSAEFKNRLKRKDKQ